MVASPEPAMLALAELLCRRPRSTLPEPAIASDSLPVRPLATFSSPLPPRSTDSDSASMSLISMSPEPPRSMATLAPLMASALMLPEPPSARRSMLRACTTSFMWRLFKPMFLRLPRIFRVPFSTTVSISGSRLSSVSMVTDSVGPMRSSTLPGSDIETP